MIHKEKFFNRQLYKMQNSWRSYILAQKFVFVLILYCVFP